MPQLKEWELLCSFLCNRSHKIRVFCCFPIGLYRNKKHGTLFYQSHKTIRFDTLSGFGEYEVVAVFKTAAYSQQGFKYYHFINTEDETSFNEYISKCKKFALYDTGVTAAAAKATAQIDTTKANISYDVLEMSGSRAVWPKVLAVYAVKTTTDLDNAQEVATIDDNKKRFSKIFSGR